MLFFQDLYVVVPEPSCDFSGLALPAEAEGFVEHCSLVPGRLRLSGWIVDRVLRAAPRELRVSIGGEVRAVLDRFEPREEVAALFPYEQVTGYGWRAEVPVGSAAVEEGAVVAVEVVDAAGRTSALYADTILAALLRSVRLDLHTTSARLDRRNVEAQENQACIEGLRRTIQELESRIAAMERSRFWKLRNAWWRVKRRLRSRRESEWI
jgi:hypothetical protein